MTSPYIANTPSDQKSMLKVVGVKEIEDLYSSIPPDVRLRRPLQLPGPINEFDLRRQVESMMGGSRVLRERVFLGGGLYDHVSPTLVDQLTLRGEFLTAYTPYQPEISQGTLQVLFEYQTMMASLFGMEVSNASHYDGATALADAALMCLRLSPEIRTVLVPQSLHPDYRATLRTYLSDMEVEFEEIAALPDTGCMDTSQLAASLAKGPRLVLVQSPNYLGTIEPLEKISTLARGSAGSRSIAVVTEPLSLALLRPPGSLGFDVAVGEGQSFGLSPSFGGPLLGILTTRKEHLRQLPGRVCGMSVDTKGERSFVLTLSTREQHIRRQKATSNICTNQNLCVVMATIYLSLLGRRGLHKLAAQNVALTQYLRSRIARGEVAGAGLGYPQGRVFNEFVVRFAGRPARQVVEKALRDTGTVLGIPLDRLGKPHDLLVSVTETKKRQDLDAWVLACQQGVGA